MSNVAVYLRVSTKAQRVDSQKREIERYLAGHGVSKVRWFVDHYSGKPGSVTERPALRELQAAVFAGEVKTIVLYRLDRLARSIRDGINLLTDWLSAGVRVVVVTMQIDLSGALGQTVAALLLGLAQMEREAIRERQAAGIAAARARGQTWGGRRRASFKVDPTRVAELTAKGLSSTSALFEG
jgi:DNA invertase Pin-like site-specific DNA recombinase